MTRMRGRSCIPSQLRVSHASRPSARNGSRLAAPSSDDNMASVRVWDTSSGKETGVLTVNLAKRPAGSRRSELSGLAFGPDGRTVAATDDQGGLYLWNLAGKEPQHPGRHDAIRNPKPGETSFAKVAFGLDGTWLATACPGERGSNSGTPIGAQVRSLSQHEPGKPASLISPSVRGVPGLRRSGHPAKRSSGPVRLGLGCTPTGPDEVRV